jgi:DNA-binding SARP family transcriptional activator
VEPATRIQLCGKFLVRLEGRRVERDLPGAQGRALFAYLCLNRTRPVTRGEATDALWGDHLPSAPTVALNALVSKLRRVMGAERLEGKGALRMSLAPDAQVDVELAQDLLHRSRTALAAGDPAGAWTPAHVILLRGFMPGHEGPWIEKMRRELDEALLDALECAVNAKLGIGGREVEHADRLARRLVALAPYRESAYGLLMQVLAARGNFAEALRIYEELRVRLRDELGIAPGPAVQEVHRTLLAQV